MLIGGIQTLTLVDYPETVGAIIFTAGCNMRCGYCHNEELVLPDKIKCRRDFIPPKKVLNFLKTRQGFLEGLVISGGEPTVQPDLLDFMRAVKALKFKVKLDTNGTNPVLVEQALNENLIDYLALDIKTTPNDYNHLTQANIDFPAITKTRALVSQAGIDHELRTTLIKGYHTPEKLLKIAQLVQGSPRWTLQTFRPQKTLDACFSNYSSFSQEEMQDIKKELNQYVENIHLI